MTTPNGYNNPAYCHQYDSSLYDYQYVPEIDPDSPDLRQELNRKTPQATLVHPSFENFQRESPESSEFEGSDESNRSIIVEECNNRRVTLICEKRNEADVCEDEFYDDRNFRAAYFQDISLESENGYDNKGIYSKTKKDERSLRHQRALKPPVEQNVRIRTSSSSNKTKISRNPSVTQSTTSMHSYQRPQRQHRYEEIPYDDDCIKSEPLTSVHRYAEITVDENGYPTLSKEIEIEQRKNYQENENHTFKIIPKQRAISPINYLQNFSPPPTPSRTPQKAAKEFDFSAPQFSPSSPSPIIYSSSPTKTDSFEMSELSPPGLSNEPQRINDHTFFINSPKRQPPIGASGSGEPRARYPPTEKCILPKNLQQIIKSGKRSHSVPNSPIRRDFGQTTSPSQIQANKKLTQIFHIQSNQPAYKITSETRQKGSTPARKNILHYFSDQPNEKMITRSPYKPTTAEINPSRTAIITPILQRKSQQYQYCVSPVRNFEKMSQAFQSTGNIFKSAKETCYSGNADFTSNPTQKVMSPMRIKRNQSVPNFAQSLASESRIIAKKQEGYEHGNDKYSKNLDLEYSPKKPAEHLSPTQKSRISLIDQTSSWSTLDGEYHPRCSACFIFAALVHLVTASATCAISFYLLSKVGRKYYLDFGVIAGFVNFILGLLGFRSYCWKWLPNRNYVSGFIGLAAFSALTCAGLTYLITAKPMAGDPIIDIMGGAICAVSVLTIVLALTGLTMSSCCKTPPPDNRVTDL